MKIAFIYDAVYPYVNGGAEKRIYEIGTRLSQKGHDIHIYGIKWWSGASQMKRDGITYHGVCGPMRLYNGLGRRSIREAVWFSIKLYGPLVKETFNIIDCQNFPYFSCICSSTVSRMKKTPMILTWHEVWGPYWNEYMGRAGFVGEQIERVCTRLTKNNIAVSEKNRSLLEACGMSRENINVMPNGIDLTQIKETEPASKGFDVLFVGRLIREKNVDKLLQSLKKVSSEKPEVTLGIIGDGPERQGLQALAERIGIEKNLEFLGFQKNHEEVISYMKSSKMLVLPSTREGFGIAALEANACGLPVITTNHPMNAAGDLIKDGVNGCAGPLSVEYFAEKMIELLGDESLCEKMGATGKKVAAQYDWDNITDGLEEYYEKVV